MPLNKCESDGDPGWKWGESGKCYTYTAGDDAASKRAKKLAVKQAIAIGGGKAPEASFAKMETVDLEGVEIAAADIKVFGTAETPEGKGLIAEQYSVERLEKIAADSNAATDLRPPLKIGHSKEQTLLRNSGLAPDEEPAAGWLENFRVDGDKLLCDIKGVPKKLAKLAETAFRTRSPELGAHVDQETDAVYPEVVKGLALLGVTPPAFQTLNDVVATFSKGEARESVGLTAALIDVDEAVDDEDVERVAYFAAGPVVWDVERGANDVMEDLRRALNPDATGPYPSDTRYWVRDVVVEGSGGRALVDDYQTGDASTCWVVPFSFNAEGDPVPADQATWILAEQAWVAASSDAASTSIAAAPTPARATSEFAARAAATDFSGPEFRRDTTVVPETPKTPEGEEETNVELTADEATGLRRLLQMLGLAPKGEDGKEGEGDPKFELKPEAVKAFAAAVGVPDETDPAKILAAVEAAGKKADEPQIPEGMVVFSAAEKEALEQKAEAGVRAEAALAEEKKQTFLKSFARRGHIAPADFEMYGEMYDKIGPEATEKHLERLPVDTSIVQMFGAAELDELLEMQSSRGAEGGVSEEQYAAYCASTGVPYDGAAANGGGDD